MKIILEKERPVSWNKFYSGMHWTKRRQEAERVHDLVMYTVAAYQPIKYERKVNIKVSVYFKNRPYDSDNIPAKLYIDGLKGILIGNDTMEHIGSVQTESFIDKENPRVEIDIS